MVIEMLNRGIRPTHIIFADTGGEKPETYEYVWRFAEWCEARGLLLLLLRPPRRAYANTLEQQCAHYLDLPSRVFGSGHCAAEWKIEPRDVFLKALPTRPIVAIGFDGGEEHRAAGKKQVTKLAWQWYPLIEWSISRVECKRIIERAGLPVPPKSACFFCPSSKKAEIIELSRKHPALMARALEMERRATSPEGKAHTVQGLGREWSWAELLAADETKREKLREAVPGCVTCDDDACPTGED